MRVTKFKSSSGLIPAIKAENKENGTCELTISIHKEVMVFTINKPLPNLVIKMFNQFSKRMTDDNDGEVDMGIEK